MDYPLKLQSWGNSQGVRIPAPLMRELGISKDAALTAKVKGGKLVIEPAPKKKLTLEALLAQLPKNYRETEWPDGGPVGREFG